MSIHVEVFDLRGQRSETVEADSFWIGTTPQCAVELEVPDVHARILEVRRDDDGGLSIRAEGGLPFPVRCASGNVGSRFQGLLEGDLLNVGPAMIRLRVAAATCEPGPWLAFIYLWGGAGPPNPRGANFLAF